MNPDGFWQIDPSRCSNNAKVWKLGLIRKAPGVADIKNGAKIPSFLTFNFIGYKQEEF